VARMPNGNQIRMGVEPNELNAKWLTGF
jgi:hypothetical protein